MALSVVRAAAAGLAVTLALLVPAAPAVAGPEERPEKARVSLKVCDRTGCYTAWSVIDSDHDGVADADEVMAGTDPYDPRSRPGLTLLFELGTARQLPSFEAGRGGFIAFPADIVAALAKGGPDPRGAFPLHQRPDAATRAGIDRDQLAKLGIDLGRDGLTFGLDAARGDGARPATRVGGVDIRLIGYLTPPRGPDNLVEHGGVKEVQRIANGFVFTFKDGVSKSVVASDRFDGTETRYTNKDGSPGSSSQTQNQPPRTEGDTTVQDSRTVTFNADGYLESVSYVSERTGADGTKIRNTETTIYTYDENGTVIGQTKIHMQETDYSDGYNSTGVVVEACDASGGNCEVVVDEYADSNDETYINPDADTTVVTVEMVEKTLRMRGAAITVIPGWTAPGLDNSPTDPRNPTTVALIDSELAQSHLLVNPLRITTPQPEPDPRLPNPFVDGGGCWPRCG